MKNFFTKHKDGFIMPMSMLLSAIILTVSIGITTILAKEIFFSQLNRESQIAYYVADTALECATFIDDGFVDQSNGSGIFPDPIRDATSTLTQVNLIRQSRNLTSLTLNDIYCASSPIFNSSVSRFSVRDGTRITSSGGTEAIKISSYSMVMSTGDGKQRCASVTVSKSGTWRQIIARGFNTCNIGSKNMIERAVVSTSEVQ